MRPPVGHRAYFIYGDTTPVGDGRFRACGVIKRPNPLGTGIPFESSFNPQETYQTEETAYSGGVLFAKKLIDGWWKALGQ
jgi:hypothetical protein